MWRNPLPPFGTTLICPDRPVSVTPEHAYAYTAASALFGARPDHPGRLVVLDQVKSVTVDSKDVLVNGETFARADSVASARRLAQFLDGLAKRPMAERAGAIEADIEASSTRPRIEARLVEFDQAVSTLRLVCTCQFFLLSCAALDHLPRPLRVYWLHLLAGLAIGVAVIAALYARVHRRAVSRRPGDRWAGLAMMLLVPPAAVCARLRSRGTWSRGSTSWPSPGSPATRRPSRGSPGDSSAT